MFVPGKPFQPILMFVGEARSLPKSGAPEGSFTRVGSGLTRKYWTRVERLARDKHSSVLVTFVNYGRISFTTLAPGERWRLGRIRSDFGNVGTYDRESTQPRSKSGSAK